jgi:large subunit ribosomal protein L24
MKKKTTNKTISKHDLTCRIKSGDEVIVITGKDKGKQGKVERVIRKNGAVKLLVAGINLAKKHVKPNPNKGEQGGIVNKEMAIAVSNVKIYNTATGKGDKVVYKLNDEGRKVRVYKSTGELIDAN